MKEKQIKSEAPNAATPKQPIPDSFTNAGKALAMMSQQGQLPSGFDLDEACKDKAFAQLISEFEPKAAVRIYVAEKAATNAQQDARNQVMHELMQRGSLPKPQRGNVPLDASTDYMQLSSEAFGQLERNLKRAAKGGKRINL